MKKLGALLLFSPWLALAEPAQQTGIAPSGAMQLTMILSLAALLPAIVLTCTCFARFIVVFSFLKNGLGTQGAPPNQILVGLALFMTVFVMTPTATEVHQKALGPYLQGAMSEQQAIEAATPALQSFLLPRTRQQDLALFYEVSKTPAPNNLSEVPLRIAIPAFVLSELRTAFEMGLIILLPFLVIDLLVAATLMSLGMMMLPPATVSMPVKLLVFLAVDGWRLLTESLLRGVMR
jgi:flagellar biosynthesis protein FliP